MPRLNHSNYLEAVRGRYKVKAELPGKNFWLVRDNGKYNGLVEVGKIYFPKDKIGKRVKIKVIYCDDED